MIICSCNKVIFDGFALKIRVGFFRDGFMTLKCPQCKAFIQGVNAKLLTGEIQEDIDLRQPNVTFS